ncbi:MAG TPA: WD40 repeat domain-containing protein [Caulobacteraceae bacterium]|nr:WD40 repeat domain-containing protein [Caulobacteraceae bacterium]
MQPIEAPIHEGAITACAFLGGSGELATASIEGAVVVWDVAAGRPTRRFRLHRGPIMALAWDAPRGRLISAGRDRRIVSCDPESGDAVGLGEHPAGLYALAIAPGGGVLASGGYGGEIRLWRLPDGQPLGALSGHDGAVLDLDFLDDARVVSVGRDYQVVVWHVARSAECVRTAGHRRWAMRVRASADGREIYSAGEDGQVCGWAADSGARLWRKQFQSPVWGLERSADGAALIVGAGGLAARLDLGSEGPSEPQPLASETARAICRSGSGLMALGADKLILYRADRPQTPLRRLSLGAPLYASVAAVRRSGERADQIDAVMTRNSGQIDLDLSGARRALRARHQGIAFASCVVAPSRFATVGFDGMIHLLNAADGELARSMDHGGLVFSVSASSDGSRLLAVGSDALSLWDTASGERVWGGEGLGVGFHVWGALAPDASFALAVGEGPTLHSWRFTADGAQRERLALDFGRLIGTCGLMAVASLDPTSAAVATAAGEVRRVDLATGRSSLLHAAHESGVRAMTLAPDGRRLLSFSENGVTRIYDLWAGRDCTPAAIAEAVVPAACFTPQGDLVWVDGAGRLHHLAPEA